MLREEPESFISCDPIAVKCSAPVLIVNVSVGGGWGEWAAWSDCKAECGRGVRGRQRKCDSPAPLNGGPGCEGPAIQKKSCSALCPAVDGGWSSWSAWSGCTVDCRVTRRRSCTRPTPSSGGRYCQGRDLNTRNCTGGRCPAPPPAAQLPVLVLDRGQAGAAPPNGQGSLPASDLTLYIGLAVAALVFLLVVFILVRLLQRKRSPPAGYSLTPAGETRKLAPHCEESGGKSWSCCFKLLSPKIFSCYPNLLKSWKKFTVPMR